MSPVTLMINLAHFKLLYEDVYLSFGRRRHAHAGQLTIGVTRE